jgi:hypothetical protein
MVFGRFVAAFYIFLGLTSPAASALPIDGTWSESGNVDGIKVYRRPFGDNGLTEFRSKMIISSDISRVAAVVIEGKNFASWLDGCKLSEEFERQISYDPRQSLAGQFTKVYGVNSAPWPLSDRDYVVRSHMEMMPVKAGEPQGYLLHSELASDSKYPERKDRVRMLAMKVTIALTTLPKDPGATEVDMAIVVDTAADGPKTLTEAVLKNFPANSLLKLSGLVKTDGFDAKLANALRQRLSLANGKAAE